MLWFLLFLAIFIWAFGFKGTVKIALIAIAGWFVLLTLLVFFGS
jgi:hypothetical protein|tara:strand:- start:287 stop:418 length:132 start_codon:yes stop_codon:yes gene_type:complete